MGLTTLCGATMEMAVAKGDIDNAIVMPEVLRRCFKTALVAKGFKNMTNKSSSELLRSAAQNLDSDKLIKAFVANTIVEMHTSLGRRQFTNHHVSLRLVE